MFGDFDDFEQQVEKEKKVKVFINGDAFSNPYSIRIIKNMRMRDFAKQLDEKFPGYFHNLRIFNQEGVELLEDDINYIKNGTTLFASAGEEFDSNSTFSEYEMVKELGEGGFGKVLLGVHRSTKEKVAIKIVKTNLIGNAQDIDMVFREAGIMKSLDHKNIVKIKNCFTLSNMQVVFVMEYLEGGELLARLEEKEIFSEEESKKYFKQIVEAMSYCHRNNLIHRDLKLENVLLASKESNDVKIIDFGIAGCSVNPNVDNLDAGSLRYMAPEVLQGQLKKLTSAIDVWAMGVILYSMVFGELPFAGETNAQIKDLICSGELVFPHSIAKKLSSGCKDVLKLTLDVNPATRISTVDLMNHPWISDKCKLIQCFEEQQKQDQELLEKKNLSSTQDLASIKEETRVDSPSTNANFSSLKTSPNSSYFKSSNLTKSAVIQQSPQQVNTLRKSISGKNSSNQLNTIGNSNQNTKNQHVYELIGQKSPSLQDLSTNQKKPASKIVTQKK